MPGIFRAFIERPTGRYVLAASVVAMAYGLRFGIVQGLGLSLPPFITFFPAIMFVAVFAGRGPGLLATGLSALVADYLILPPVGSLHIAKTSDALALALFAGSGVVTSLLAERYFKSQRLLAVYKSEQALLLSQEKLNVALASMNDAVFISDAKGQFLQFNDAFATFHKFGSKAECARTLAEYPEFLEVSTADGQTAPLEMWAVPRALRGETASSEEYGLRRKDTGETWIGSYSFSPVRDNAGAIIGSVVVGRDITEQKRAEQELRKSETLYRGLFSSMEEGFCIIEMIFDAAGKPADYRFLEINAAFERQTGLHGATGKRMRELAPTHEEYWFEIYGKIALSGEPAHFFNEAKALKAYYEVRAYRVGEPELRHVAIVFSDISERRHAEAHIQQLSRIYAVLSDTNQTIVRVKDSQAMLETVCRIAVEKGKFQMAWIGMVDPVTKLMEPIAFSGVVEGFLDLGKISVQDSKYGNRPSVRCFASGVHAVCNDIEQEIDFRPLREEALRRGYWSGGSFPLKVDGKTVGVFNLYANEKGIFEGDDISLLDEMAMDISYALEVNLHEIERQKAEVELRWRTALFESLVESNIDCILVIDCNGKKILQNQRLVEMFNIPPSIAEDSNFAKQLDWVGPFIKNTSEFREKIRHLISCPDEVCRDEIELEDGRIFDRYTSPVRDKANHYYGRIFTLRDITEPRQLEERLRQAQKMEAIGQLTGGIAHDFNNLLTVILGCSEVIGEEVKANPRLTKMAEMVMGAARRGADLTHRMLAFARRQALAPRSVHVNHLIVEMESFLRRTLSAEIELCVIKGSLECEAVVDPTQLESALLNLCLNARDAMPNGGTLTIETGNAVLDSGYAAHNPEVIPGQYVLLAVSDTGTGIKPEHLDRVFDPFFTTKEAGKGTGLGLSMVYGFVKQSQGHIKIYSELRYGTSVKIYLPKADKTSESFITQSTPFAELRGSELVLLVEDNDPVRDFAKSQLENLGYRVLEASNGKHALEILRKHTDVDLLFTDVVMPGGMNGRELAQEACMLIPRLKVLYSSGYAENAIVEHRLLGQEVRLLNKPYSRLELASRVRNALNGV